MNDTPYCPDCGCLIGGDGWSQELCPNCLMRLALVESTGTASESEDGETELTEGLDTEVLVKGQILGNRYGIRTLLGRGGMGEVWRAFDLKLRVDVALKAVRLELAEKHKVMELLRREVRSAREVASPNVCRVYDLEELDGRELVSMEYVEGDTLRDVLRSRGPLHIQEAREIASQFLAGLEAIHQAGLVHRDLKPANVMITPAGRVVVMDFGIAKDLDETGTGTISGTPAYMAPEQSRGEDVDARADVFSAGLLLAEMLAIGGAEDFKARETLWLGVRQEPPQLPDSPWRNVLEKAVAHRPELRFDTASALARALEEVTLRVAGAEDLRPYPGLVAFTDKDREYFFGRELETEALWKKIRRLHMLALIGPSGAGKTSFVRAGLLANTPSGWSYIVCTPGQAPITSLREALAPELSNDSDAIRELVRVEDPDAMVSAVTRWRSRSRRALLVVDQFEELFTLNPPEVQRQYTELLARLAIDADVRILLSLRDDFLIRCHAHEALKPILSELTLLGPPAGAALRRAIVQPALKCGYRFDDEGLVDEMLSEVEGERGALPLVAFAASELWERRDKDQGLLTREAYEVIGGVGGALAQHAELLLERIGADRVPTARELFRNLVTAEGTRAVRDRDELLSVFEKGSGPDNREAAAEVLDALIDARLLTSYGADGDEGTQDGAQRIEIVHESLLAAWPRLVRWMTQDVEGAQLRDQLRQAARTWQDRDRSEDLLWTGSAFLEYELWRERYPGSLSEIEEAFADAMQALASRRRRRRRGMATGVVAALVVILAVVTALWRQSVVQTRRAEAETARAEASKLVTLGHIALEEERAEALAYAIAALERADTPGGRQLALSTLWAGSPPMVLPQGQDAFGVSFAPDGRHLAVGTGGGLVRVFARDGSAPVHLDDLEGKGITSWVRFSPDSRYLLASAVMGPQGDFCIWETEGWQLKRVIQIPDVTVALGQFEPNGKNVITCGFTYDGPPAPHSEQYGTWVFHRWPLDGGRPEFLGELEGNCLPPPLPDVDRGIILVGQGKEVWLHRLATLGVEPGRVIARHSQEFGVGSIPAFDPTGNIVAFSDEGGHLMLWPLDGDGSEPLRRFNGERHPFSVAFSPDGSLLAQAAAQQATALWGLRGPTGAEPLQLGRRGPFVAQVAFSPDGRWLATAGHEFGIALWPLMDRRYCRVLRGHEGVLRGLAFSPDGSRLYTQGDTKVLAWDLSGGAGLEPMLVLETTSRNLGGLTMDPLGRFLVVRDARGGHKVPLDGTTPILLEAVLPGWSHEIGPSGRLLAVARLGSIAPSAGDALDSTVIVLDLESDERWFVEPPGEGRIRQTTFDPAGRLFVLRGRVLSRWSDSSGTCEVVDDDWDGLSIFFFLRDGRMIDIHKNSLGMRNEIGIFDLEDETFAALPRVWRNPSWIQLNDDETVVATMRSGEIRVGPMLGEEAQRIPFVKGRNGFRLSPDGRWIATSNTDGSVRLWPVPDLDRPPLHTLGHDDLLARLKALTNLRVVPDETGYTGYKVEPDFSAYPGWAEVPSW